MSRKLAWNLASLSSMSLIIASCGRIVVRKWKVPACCPNLAMIITMIMMTVTKCPHPEPGMTQMPVSSSRLKA